MAITFGAALDDVTADPAELRLLLAGPQDEDGDEVEEELAADPDPGWGEPGLGERLIDAAKGARGPAPKASAKVRRDVQAKTALMLQMLAGTWRMRDPLCGGAALDAVPEVSDALADILCDSPDVVAWFTATGGFMKWVKLAMAVQPVATMALQHHVLHTVALDEDEDQAPGPDWSGYGA